MCNPKKDLYVSNKVRSCSKGNMFLTLFQLPPAGVSGHRRMISVFRDALGETFEYIYIRVCVGVNMDALISVLIIDPKVFQVMFAYYRTCSITHLMISGI